MCKNKLDVDQIPLTESNDGSYTVHCTSQCRYFMRECWCNFYNPKESWEAAVIVGMKCPIYWTYYE